MANYAGVVKYVEETIRSTEQDVDRLKEQAAIHLYNNRYDAPLGVLTGKLTVLYEIRSLIEEKKSGRGITDPLPDTGN